MRATSRIGLLGAVLLAGGMLWLTGANASAAGDDIGGVVRSAAGGEAGVWVIAETDDLETTFRKIVVTGDDGRFLVPDLPDADYEVWVRGYGLVDSDKHPARPGDDVTLAVTAAATPQEAARIYPSQLLVLAAGSAGRERVSGHGAGRQRHQRAHAAPGRVGRPAQGRLPALPPDGQHGDPRDADAEPGRLRLHLDAWEHRVQVGRSGPSMSSGLNRMGRERALGLFADWTDRIAAGEVPPAPPRPQGPERNLVLTQWGWGDTMAMVHDEIATDKRNPHLYPNGPAVRRRRGGAGHHRSGDPHLGADGHDDPRSDAGARRFVLRHHRAYTVTLLGHRAPDHPGYSAHNPMLDAKGRLWITQSIRPPENPDWCQSGSEHPSARNFPISRSQRQLSYYDTESGEFVHIDTCYMTHHTCSSPRTRTTRSG